MAVEVKESVHGDVRVMRIEGRLDAATSPIVERKVNEAIEGGAHKLVFNFAGVDYLSSAGMRLLLTVSKKVASKGGRLSVAEVSDEVMEVIKMAGFDRVLDLHGSETDALKSF
jgi:anti-anti-sigma factor